jgi:hyaluronoglucosaminidase
MPSAGTFQRRGIVEGFFGPPWSIAHRAAIFEFGATRGMNTYLYAPKDDPYHRERWTEPYPDGEWGSLLRLIRAAQERRVDFVYGFHPGKGLRFGAKGPVDTLTAKARRFYDAGVRTFAVLFDDIPSHLEHDEDRRLFDSSLARAEALWLARVLENQPANWENVEWWICPSYYTEDPRLPGMFGSFEPRFLETLAEHLPREMACFWTGPAVVSKKITAAHVRRVAKQISHPLILWDNYPVNDLGMSDEMHIGPLTGRDPRLPECVYGYLNNPLLQEELSFIPLATCFDYAADPAGYDAEQSWEAIVSERFGAATVPQWRIVRKFCDQLARNKNRSRPVPPSRTQRRLLEEAHRYLSSQQDRAWFAELRPWIELMEIR